jgi:S-DNA-T family DNA segregation ATPase FtsK/SpoIIIE
MAQRSTYYTFTLLPDAAKAFLRRRASELCGLTLLFGAAALALALATYTPGDPSLDNATAAAPQNWLGAGGAVVADVVLQGLGIGGILLVLAPAAWAWRLIAHRGLPIWRLNLTVLPVALLCVAMFASSMPAPEAWPLRVGLGGWLGDLMLHLLYEAAAAIHIRLALAPARAVALILAVTLAGLSLGLSRYEWIVIGRLCRWGGYFLARLGLLIAAALPRPQKPSPSRIGNWKVENGS